MNLEKYNLSEQEVIRLVSIAERHIIELKYLIVGVSIKNVNRNINIYYDGVASGIKRADYERHYKHITAIGLHESDLKYFFRENNFERKNQIAVLNEIIEILEGIE